MQSTKHNLNLSETIESLSSGNPAHIALVIGAMNDKPEMEILLLQKWHRGEADDDGNFFFPSGEPAQTATIAETIANIAAEEANIEVDYVERECFSEDKHPSAPDGKTFYILCRPTDPLALHVNNKKYMKGVWVKSSEEGSRPMTFQTLKWLNRLMASKSWWSVGDNLLPVSGCIGNAGSLTY